jgi:heat shock protein HslJ
MRLVPLLAAALLLLAACGEPGSAATPPPENPMRGRTFLSTSITENGQPRPLVAKTRVRIQFAEDGRLIADAGCNSMQGPVRVEGGQLHIDGMSITEMACEPALQQQDEWLSAFLTGRPSWKLDGDNLTLTSGNTELVLLDRAVAEPDLSLEGTKWTVDTTVDGEVASSVPPGVAAHLTFQSGQLRGSGGCNTLGGQYTLTGSTIRFENIGTTLKLCSQDVMTVERAVTDLLQGEVTYSIEADRLTLKHPSGKGLQLHTERP